MCSSQQNMWAGEVTSNISTASAVRLSAALIDLQSCDAGSGVSQLMLMAIGIFQKAGSIADTSGGVK